MINSNLSWLPSSSLPGALLRCLVVTLLTGGGFVALASSASAQATVDGGGCVAPDVCIPSPTCVAPVACVTQMCISANSCTDSTENQVVVNLLEEHIRVRSCIHTLLDTYCPSLSLDGSYAEAYYCTRWFEWWHCTSGASVDAAAGEVCTVVHGITLHECKRLAPIHLDQDFTIHAGSQQGVNVKGGVTIRPDNLLALPGDTRSAAEALEQDVLAAAWGDLAPLLNRVSGLADLPDLLPWIMGPEGIVNTESDPETAPATPGCYGIEDHSGAFSQPLHLCSLFLP